MRFRHRRRRKAAVQALTVTTDQLDELSRLMRRVGELADDPSDFSDPWELEMTGSTKASALGAFSMVVAARCRDLERAVIELREVTR